MPEINRDEAKKLLEQIARESCIGDYAFPRGTKLEINKRLYLSKDRVNEAIKTWRETVSPTRKNESFWFGFIDDAPSANWEHACRYVFIYDDGFIQTNHWFSPPEDEERYNLEQISEGKLK